MVGYLQVVAFSPDGRRVLADDRASVVVSNVAPRSRRSDEFAEAARLLNGVMPAK